MKFLLYIFKLPSKIDFMYHFIALLFAHDKAKLATNVYFKFINQNEKNKVINKKLKEYKIKDDYNAYELSSSDLKFFYKQDNLYEYIKNFSNKLFWVLTIFLIISLCIIFVLF